MGRSKHDAKANTEKALGTKKIAAKNAGKGQPLVSYGGSIEGLSDFGSSDEETDPTTKPAKVDKADKADKDAVAEEEPTSSTKRKRRFRPGTRALIDIKKAQKSTERSFRKTSFRRLVKEILQDMEKADVRVTENAYEAIQESAETWLTGLYRESNRAARNSKRIKITAGDFRLVYDLIMSNGLDQLMNEKYRYSFNGATVRRQPKGEKQSSESTSRR
jgi:histone H3